jgi:transposase
LAGAAKCEIPRLNVLRLSGLQFVPAVDAGSSPVPQPRASRCKADASAGTIEVEINGATVRVGRGADAKTMMVVLRALKGGV